MHTQPVKSRSHFSRSTHIAPNSPGYANLPSAAEFSFSLATANSPSTATPATSCAGKHECLMLLTVGIDCANQCRQLLMKTCGDGIVFIRTQPVARAAKIKVWLGVSDAFTGQVMDAVMRALPSAEFGRITHEPA